MVRYGYKMKRPLSGAIPRQPLRAVQLRAFALILVYSVPDRSQEVFGGIEGCGRPALNLGRNQQPTPVKIQIKPWSNNRTEQRKDRADIAELHFIAPIGNLVSIMQAGILSHKLAGRKAHDSVAMVEIQERRKNKRIPGAKPLHEYANLYFDAHNPMLSKRREQNDEICVLRIDTAVLDLPGVIVADRNAASDWVSFSPVSKGIRAIDKTRVFARYWTHPNDPYDEMSHKSEKCAEVPVPDRVDPQFIVGAYVANQTAVETFRRLNIPKNSSTGPAPSPCGTRSFLTASLKPSLLACTRNLPRNPLLPRTTN